MRADEGELGAGKRRFDHAARENTEIDIPRNDSLCRSRSPFDKNRLNFDTMFCEKYQIMRHPERRERAAKAWENDLERLRLRSRATRQARKKTNSEKREKQLHLRSPQFESLLKEPQLATSPSALDPSACLLRSSLVSKYTRTKGRVVESAGIRFYRKRSGPDRCHNRPWSGSGGGRQDTGPLPAFGTARPLGFEERELSRYL